MALTTFVISFAAPFTNQLDMWHTLISLESSGSSGPIMYIILVRKKIINDVKMKSR